MDGSCQLSLKMTFDPDDGPEFHLEPALEPGNCSDLPLSMVLGPEDGRDFPS